MCVSLANCDGGCSECVNERRLRGTRKADDPEAAWNDGYDQAVEEVLDEVRKHSPTMYSAIVNKYAAWKEIMQQREDQLTLSGGKP
jgi:hypothetical protein